MSSESIIVPTDHPEATEKEYRDQGWLPENLYAKPFYRSLCDPELNGGFQWAISFFKPTKTLEQPNLL